MRASSESGDQCQAKLDIMVDAFMRDDWAMYREGAAWLRDFTYQKGGCVKSGGNWFMPQKIEAVRNRARMRLEKGAAP